MTVTVIRSASYRSTDHEIKIPTVHVWLSFHVFMRLIFTNIIMQHTSHFKWLHHHPSKAQEPSHCHHGDRRSPTPTRAELSEKSVTRQLHPNFHSVSVMFLEWNCLSGLAPLKPIIVLRPVLGWPAGLTCHSNCLTHSPQTTHVENNESRFTPGWAHPMLSFLIGSKGWLLWQHIIIAGSGTDKS